MTGRFAARGGLSILAVAAVLAGAVSPAGAERYLLDFLFNNDRAQRTAPQPLPPRAVREAPSTPAPRARTPRISSPSYYNYKPDGLVKVDFAALAASLAGEGGEAGERTSSPFGGALDGLVGYELLAEKPIAAALLAHYSEEPAFIWAGEDGPNARARAVMRVLDDAASFGLSETDYVVPVPARGSEEPWREQLVRFEMALSARALRYARDAGLGRVDPNRLSGYHDFPAKPLDARAVLEVLAGAAAPDRYLQSLHPQNAAYAALREELKALRASAEKEIVVDPDTFVRPGQSHDDFPKILRILERDADEAFRSEHGAVLIAHLGSDTYARELVPVIKAAQKRHDLNPDGIIGRRTVGALAGESKAMRIEKVLLAMERLRWHPSRLGSTRVMINAASFTAHYIEDDTEKLAMRAVVGTRANQTSFFHDEVEYVEYNPYWGVPQSILVNEKLPRLRQDPGYLDRAGYEVTDARGRRVSSASVDWTRYGAKIPFNVRQKPGPSNALGELKIMFPNKHDIYMHDTPQKHLFGRDTRAFSHGCVRLQDPRAMAAAVLGTSVDEVGRRIGEGRNARQDAPRKIPVYVGYFTAWAEPSGSGVSYHADTYGRDEALRKALAKVEELRAPGS